MKFSKSLLTISFAMGLLLLSIAAHAGEIKLGWQSPKTPPDFDKFRIKWGTQKGNYPNEVDVPRSQTTAVIKNLATKKTYHFIALTVTRAGKESEPSNVASVYLDADTDRDGILDQEEKKYGLNPNLADTDGDGIRDKAELDYWGSAWSKDSDGDGKINILDADSDNDGATDGQEIAGNFDPTDPDSKPPVKPITPRPPLEVLPIASIFASDAQRPNVPIHTTDGNLRTSWAAQGDGQWITFDLGGNMEVGEVDIAWFHGNQRRSSFTVQVSPNGKNWKDVFRGDSGGNTLDLEAYEFALTPARFVRIVGFGNTKNNWNNIAEVEIRGVSHSSMLPVVDVRASDAQHPNVAIHTTDGDRQTRWAAQGDGQWIMFDLGGNKDVAEVAVAWTHGDRRRASFNIEVSPDGKSWKEVFSGESSGKMLGLESYPFSMTLARYVRIVGFGNTSNNWNNITEVEIHGVSHSSMLPVVDVRASDAQHPNVAIHTTDGDRQTRWAAQGDGQWIMFDLGGNKDVAEVVVAWTHGDRRRASFNIEVSPDGKSWKEVFSGESSGKTLGLESYPFSAMSARYVRIVGFGNTSNNWNNITEVEIHGAMK